ncbi:MAG: DUF2868 domain-containing protein [Verrucomicrobiales bacterium]|nr:DUF2868 domain-containing protein [Verrucomicrobiales bacterium]
MKLSDIRNIVIAQALEESDSGGRLISDGEKRLADAAAGAPLATDSGVAKQNAFLAKRASSVIGTVEPRLEGDRSWLRGSPFRSKFSLFSIIIVFVAGIVGYLTNELGSNPNINILQFPLIGILVWNLFVYLGEILVFFRKDGETSGISGVVCRALFPPPVIMKKEENESSLEFRARALFQSRWRQINLPPLSARVKATLHITALVLAASAVTGMYVKGIAKEYKANWESTFFESGDQLEPFLKVVLGPASKITGDRLPTGAELDELNIKNNPTGENAARWIHWYAVTVMLFVLIPRLLLAVLWHFRSLAKDRQIAFRDISPAYFDRVLALATGDSLGIVIVPYAHQAGDNVVQGIRTYMEDIFRRPVSIQWKDVITFGDEEEAEVEIPKNLQPMLLFNFASTPEKETHLALYRKLAGDLPENSRPYQVILDCEAFDRKAESFNDAEERRATRLQAWNNLFAAENCDIHMISDHAIAVKDEQSV